MLCRGGGKLLGDVPLAQQHRQVEGFVMFIGGKEVANAYTELNDPEVQRCSYKDGSAN